MYIKVFVTPSAKREKVENHLVKKEEDAGALDISVREPAEGNMANTRVRELVGLRFGQPLSHVRILTGHHSRVKIISVGSISN